MAGQSHEITHLALKINMKKATASSQTFETTALTHHCLTTWQQIYYHSMLWRDLEKRLGKAEKLIPRPTRGSGEKHFVSRETLQLASTCRFVK